MAFDATTTVPEKYLNQIKTVLGWPTVDNILLSDSQITELCVSPALYEYFIKFPVKQREQYSIQDSFSIEFPENAIGVLNAGFTEKAQYGRAGSSSSFWSIIAHNQQFSGLNNRNSYMSRYNWNGSRHVNKFQRQELETYMNEQTSTFFVNNTERKVEAYSQLKCNLAVTWGITSENFNDVKHTYIYDVIKLAQAELLNKYVDTVQLVDTPSLDIEANVDDLRSRSEDLRTEVKEKWLEIPDVVMFLSGKH